MRILLVNTFYYPEIKGGAEYSVKKLAEALKGEGNEILVLVSASENKEEVIDGVRIIRRKFKSLYHSYGDVKKNPFTMVVHRILDFCNPFNGRILNSVICGFKPDIIHTNNLYEITPEIWRVAHKKHIPVVHTIRDYYLMCIKTNLLKKDNSVCYKPNIFCIVYQQINCYLTKYVDVLTAPSAMMIEQVKSRKFFSKAEYEVVYNAIEYDQNLVLKKCKKHSNGDTITFVYLGGLHVHKGIDILLDAFQNIDYSQARLVIAGKGAEEQKVIDACTNDSRIKYAGFLDETGVNNLLEVCDVLICPSIWNEPFGRVILDAYKNGLPVIATKVGALPEIVCNMETGILVPPGSSNDLQKAMEYFIKNGNFLEDCKQKLCSQLDKFSLQNQASAFMEIYERL